jgi:hypothetical protein
MYSVKPVGHTNFGLVAPFPFGARLVLELAQFLFFLRRVINSGSEVSRVLNLVGYVSDPRT